MIGKQRLTNWRPAFEAVSKNRGNLTQQRNETFPITTESTTNAKQPNQSKIFKVHVWLKASCRLTFVYPMRAKRCNASPSFPGSVIKRRELSLEISVPTYEESSKIVMRNIRCRFLTIVVHGWQPFRCWAEYLPTWQSSRLRPSQWRLHSPPGGNLRSPSRSRHWNPSPRTTQITRRKSMFVTRTMHFVH